MKVPQQVKILISPLPLFGKCTDSSKKISSPNTLDLGYPPPPLENVQTQEYKKILKQFGLQKWPKYDSDYGQSNLQTLEDGQYSCLYLLGSIINGHFYISMLVLWGFIKRLAHNKWKSLPILFVIFFPFFFIYCNNETNLYFLCMKESLIIYFHVKMCFLDAFLDIDIFHHQ